MNLSTGAPAPDARIPQSAPPRARLGGGLAVVGAYLLVVALVAAAHWPVLEARAISLDDNSFIRDNPLVTRPGWESTSRFFREVLRPSTVGGYYLPLTMSSLMVDYALGGRPDDLRAFHRTNLALHLLAAALLVLLLHRLFGALLPAAIAGLLFGLHPLTVEPVAWVGERKTLLAACFALASMLAYVESRRRRAWGWTAVSVGCFALALLSKPTVAPLPVLLLLVDWWPLRRLNLRAVVEKWPFVALSIASAIITVISHQRSAVIVPMSRADLLHWPLHAGYLLAFYLGKILVPIDLTCVYPPPKPFTLSNPVVAVNVMIIAALAVIVLAVARRARGPLASALFFVLAIAPTLGLVQYSWVIASDKYVYFPAVGLMLAIGAGLAAVGARRPASAWVPLLAIPLALIMALEAHGVRVTLRHWRDTPTLVHHMERLAPDAPAVKNCLALLAMSQSRPDEAIRYLREVVASAPGFGDAQYNLGILLANRGDVAEAVEHLRYACAELPNDGEALGALGVTLRATGRPSEAIVYLRRALALTPDFQPVLVQLGEALIAQGEHAEGVKLLRRAVGRAANDPALRFGLAAALLRVHGGTAEAIVHLRRTIELKPAWAEPLNTLAWVLATSPDSAIRDPAEAKRLANRAVELTENRRPEPLDTLAAALAACGDFGQAVQLARRAAEIARRGHAEALAREIGTRMMLYRRGLAYTEPQEAAAGPTP
jgi:Flp pilus assembly protein TadD